MGTVLLIACTSVGRNMIETIENSAECAGIELSGVINLSQEAAVGKANYDSYIDLFMKYKISHYYCENVNENQCIDFMKKCAPDIIIQSGWSQKFSQSILNLPRYKCIGEHPAPLPKGRGAACVNWAIINGEKEWGDTFFEMEMQYDTGAILAQKNFLIENYDDVKTVYDKVSATSVSVLKEKLMDWVNGKFDFIQQNDMESTHYPRRKPSDGEFDFEQDSVKIYNQIRGQTKPYPGAFFYKNIEGARRKVTVWKATLDTEEKNDGGINVCCGDGQYIRLLRVQVEGEPECWGKELQKSR